MLQDNQAQSISSYWYRTIVLPTVVTVLFITVSVGTISLRNMRSTEQKSTDAVFGALSIMVADPILLGDHLELMKRISSVGSLYDLAIVVKDQSSQIIAAYPTLWNNSAPPDLPFSFDIKANNGKKIGALHGGKRGPTAFYDIVGLVLVTAVAAMAVLIFLILRAIRPIFSDIISLAVVNRDPALPVAETPKFRFSEIKTTYELLRTQGEKVLRHEQDRVSIDIARQVAHDIRSPLAALQAMDKDLAILPEDTRVMLRSAINRIKDIANHLLDKNRRINKSESAEQVSIQLLSSIIDPVITEKRIQFRSNSAVEIEFQINSTSYGLFAAVSPTEFRRMISNLVNNAVEAQAGDGHVEIILGATANEITISVKDTGKGIPPALLTRLGQMGETHGKSGGSGLGLYHARTSAEAWNGKLDIASKVGEGTIITIRLPRAKPPLWFVSELKLDPNSIIIVADDDATIHQIWQGRFDSMRVHEHKITIMHFSTTEQLRHWIIQNQSEANKTIFLVDYEFLGSTETGLNVIEDMHIGSRSILVTSRFEEERIFDRSQKRGIRLIPKGMAGFVPISIGQEPIQLDLILIDDDTLLIHPMWASEAKTRGLHIRMFASPQEFLSMVDVIDRSTPMYIDVSLGPGISGIEFAHEVFKLGFTDINLATGYEPESIKAPPFVRRIVGKNFPE